MQPHPADDAGLSRRALLKQAGFGVLGASALGLLNGATAAAGAPMPANPAPSRPRPLLPPLNQFPRMVHEDYVRRVREIEQDGEHRRAALRTRADAEAYVRDAREKTRRCFGPWPEKTPLNARITGTIERESYRAEKVIFESRPGFLVTAILYLPRGRAFPRPGVVGACGHNLLGKAAPDYQSFGQALARLGYVALVFDPISQGERMQYPDADLKSRVGAAVLEHLQAGNQQMLVGEWLGQWRVWDGIRALDYLLSRPEVDPRHVGITGTSGGGTDTAWLCAAESRWTMAAPSCFVTTFRRNLENEIPADPEQYPPHALAIGLDMHDFVACMAPKPVVLLANEKDYFDLRGTHEAYERLRMLYALLGAEENIALNISPTDHGFSPPNRTAMYRWFNRATGGDAQVSEPDLTLDPPEALWCTPRGQVAALGSRSVAQLTAEKSRRLAATRPRLTGDALQAAIRSVLHLPDEPGGPDFRILRPLVKRQYPKLNAGCYAVESGPNTHAIAYVLQDGEIFSAPLSGAKRAVLYVSHQSADEELRQNAFARRLVSAEPGAAFYVCDVRGVGESKPGTCGIDAYRPYGADYFYAGYGRMLDYPYPGQKTQDVLAVLAWLKGCGHSEVHLAAGGWGTLPAVFAAVLSPLVAEVTLSGAPASLAAIAETDLYDWPASAFPSDILSHFDLPDCYAALAKKNLRHATPTAAA